MQIPTKTYRMDEKIFLCFYYIIVAFYYQILLSYMIYITNDFCCINITYPPKNDESFLFDNKVNIISMTNYLPTIVNILSHNIHNRSSKLSFEINNDHLCVSILWLPQSQLKVDIKTNKSNYGFVLNNDSHEMLTWNNLYFAYHYISTEELQYNIEIDF